MLLRLVSLPRHYKRLIAIGLDTSVIIISFFFALAIHRESIEWELSSAFIVPILLATPFSIGLFMAFGLYRAVVRFIAFSALLVILIGVAASAIILALVIYITQAPIPDSVVLNFALVSLIFVGGLRILMRALYEKNVSKEKEPVIIYGAGSAGRQLAQSLINGAEYHPVCFVDDDETLQGSTILGRRVASPERLNSLIKECDTTKVLLALPSVSRSRRKAVLDLLEPLKVSVQSIPGMADMVDGNMDIDQLQDVRIEDLLGRDPVPPQKSLMDRNIRGRNVLVTGAGGSIGAELCRQILSHEPKNLVLVEVSEYNLYAVERELRTLANKKSLDSFIKPVLCSVQNRSRLQQLMQTFETDIVYHAAAYKHVPMVEYNIVEGIRNNVFGTWNVAEAAMSNKVKDFVLVSTDKAVRPTNVMGATKRLSELVLQGAALREGNTVCFSIVRFGNVLGSSGSVIPLFRQQIIDGGPVTVTDPEITRYFMTIAEAAQLVIQASAMGSLACRDNNQHGGDVFVLDMGEPVKIDYLARKLIHLMGLEVRDKNNPHGDIEISYSGLRPGEKLYEELLIGEGAQPTDHERILTAREVSLPWNEVEALLKELDIMCSEMQVECIHQLLRRAPLAFEPQSPINDLIFAHKHKDLGVGT